MTRGHNRGLRSFWHKLLPPWAAIRCFKKLERCKITYSDVSAVAAVAEGHERPKSVIIEDYFQYPDKLRRTLRRASDEKASLIWVLNGHTMWTWDPEKSLTSEAQAEAHAAWPPEFQHLYSLCEWKRHNNGTIVIGDPKMIDGQDCDCIVMSFKGRPVGRLYLSRTTHHVMRSVTYDMLGREPPPSERCSCATIETTMSDYESFDDVTVGTRTTVVQGGRTLSQTRLLDIRFLRTIDEHLFEKPVPDPRENTTDRQVPK